MSPAYNCLPVKLKEGQFDFPLPISANLMKHYKSDEKDAGAHQIQLIDTDQVVQTPENKEIPWCSFFVISRIVGLICLGTALFCLVIFGSAAANDPDGTKMVTPAPLEGPTRPSRPATFAMLDTQPPSESGPTRQVDIS